MNTEQLLSIIEMPVITEKSTTSESLGQYVFKSNKNATKNQIKRAIEKAFDVSVINVRTMVMKGKTKRTKFGLGKRKDWKKAIVTVKAGETIDFIKLNS